LKGARVYGAAYVKIGEMIYYRIESLEHLKRQLAKYEEGLMIYYRIERLITQARSGDIDEMDDDLL